MPISHSDRKPYIGVYGNTKILKGFCTDCEAYAFVIDGALQCCDSPFTDTPTHYKREIEAVDKRKRPSLAYQEARLIAQDYRCFYCERAFHSVVLRYSRPIPLKIHWDHFVPYAYSRDNSAVNFVAACHVCNAIKSDICFETLAEARIFIESRRQAKGYA
jgi:5-methylcytosine-specific restriction endonuclease McrA